MIREKTIKNNSEVSFRGLIHTSVSAAVLVGVLVAAAAAGVRSATVCTKEKTLEAGRL